MSKSHEETLGHLSYAISQGDGFVEITGEVGTGKTTLCRVFLENLDASIHAAYIFNPTLDALQLLKAINDELGIDSAPGNTKDLIDRLNTFLIEKKRRGEKVLVLIDEAQNLSLEVLEQLRLLSNLETTQEKLLQIMLVGQPELGDMLSSYQLRQLGQRITINCRLSPLTYTETRDYIRHRIALASHRAGPPFDKSALRAIFEYSRGIPRLINIACDRALLNAFSRNSFKITGSIAREAILELTRKKAGPGYNRLPVRSGLVIGSALLIPLLILLLYFAKGQAPGIPAGSNPSSPEEAAQTETNRAVPAAAQVGETGGPPENPVPPQGEEPMAAQEEIPAPGPQDTSGKSLESLAALENKSVPATLAAEMSAAELQTQSGKDTQAFFNYLLQLNSRFSRNSAIREILTLWFPAGQIYIQQQRINADRLFFAEEAKGHDLQVQPIATEANLDLIQRLNLPAIFTFYLAGHSWPKYLAVANIDAENIYFSADELGEKFSVDRDKFLQYWSGEAYIFWKDFKNLPAVLSQSSRGQSVITLKKILQQIGYSNLSMTDRYDSDTVEIIMAIQEKYGLHIDGMVGPFTKIALYNDSPEFVKPSLVNSAAARTENGS